MKNINYKTLRTYFCISILAGLLSSLILPPASAKLENIQTDAVSTEQVQQTLGRMSVFFEENRGQFNKKVRYAARGTNGYELFLTATDAVYVLSSSRESRAEINGQRTTDNGRATAVYMTLAGANRDSGFAGSQVLEHQTNYFKGEESNWRTEIPNYQNVRMREVYPGVDMVWQGREQGAAQYDFIVQPNANPDQIEWQIKGAKTVELTAEGDLLIKTEYGDIKQNKPFTYQNANGIRQEVESRFVVSEGESFEVKFEVGEYDRSKMLTIDPSVNLSNHAFSTYLGGSGTDSGNAIAVDSAGNVYVTGETQSGDFPVTPGGFDTTANGGSDVFVTKLNATGTGLIYTTYIGGNSFGDYGKAIAVDSSGNAYLTGYSEDGANDYPTTVGAFDTTHNGGFDVFVTKLNPTGSALVYSTFLGGSSQDAGNAIAVDSVGNAYLTGYTFDSTTDYPTTIGAFDTTHNQSNDVFVTKLNATGTDLIYSTFIGGSGNDVGRGIALDSSGNAYLTGNTLDTVTDYPTTIGAFDTTHNGGSHDAFVTKLNATGTDLIYSTFIGGGGDDYGNAIAIDSAGNAYLTGFAQSGNYPTTIGAFDTTYNGGPSDVFVTKLNPTGTGLAYSTFLGGTSNIGVASGFESGNGIAVDSSGNAYLTGETVDAITDYPTTSGAFDATHNGLDDVFFTKLNATGSALTYSTFMGGGGNNYGNAIAVDSSGKAYLTGYTAGNDYPATAGAFDTTFNGGADAFVSKFGGFSTLFDYDGDERSDISIYRPSNGQWWLNRSTAGVISYPFGGTGDKIVPGDYTGDGRTDVAFWRPSTGFWYIFRSNDSSFLAFPFGITNDIPAPGDFDGDGITDVAVFRPSNGLWFILRSSDGGATTFPFGTAGDVPAVGDYDGDGRADIAIYRPSNGQWWLNRSTAGVIAYTFGGAGDKIALGDYTGDGKTDVAFWRPSNGNWFILRSENSSFFAFPFGANGDTPVPGDYDGDGKFDAGVFRSSNSTWFIQRSTAGTLIQQFGTTGDLPTPSAFIP